GMLPSHVTVAGNANAVLAFTERTAPPDPAPALPSADAARPHPPAYFTLSDVYNNRDDRRVVTLTPAKTRLQIGKDNFAFSLTSSHAGYLYLLMVGSDGKTFDMIFPNKL